MNAVYSVPTLALGSGEVVMIRNPSAGGAMVVLGDGATVVVVVLAAMVVVVGATVVVVVVEGATTQPASRATAVMAEPSLTSTVQSAGGV
jgi:hypothetical protein